MNKIKNFLKGWLEFTRLLELTLVDNLAATVPWLAPIVPAYMVFSGMRSIMDFPVWAAVVSALAVELLGMSTVTTAFQMWDYNDSKRKTDPRAPFVIAVLTVLFYLGVVITVNAILDQSAVVERIAKALLSTLGVVGAVILAIRAQHTRRLAEVAAEKAERKALRSGNLPEVSGKISNAGGKFRQDWRMLPEEDRQMIAGMTVAEIQRGYNISERGARNWKAYAKNGRQQ